MKVKIEFRRRRAGWDDGRLKVEANTCLCCPDSEGFCLHEEKGCVIEGDGAFCKNPSLFAKGLGAERIESFPFIPQWCPRNLRVRGRRKPPKSYFVPSIEPSAKACEGLADAINYPIGYLDSIQDLDRSLTLEQKRLELWEKIESLSSEARAIVYFVLRSPDEASGEHGEISVCSIVAAIRLTWKWPWAEISSAVKELRCAFGGQ